MLHQENLWQNRNSRFTCAKINAIMFMDEIACAVCICAHLQSNVYYCTTVFLSERKVQKTFYYITHIKVPRYIDIIEVIINIP